VKRLWGLLVVLVLVGTGLVLLFNQAGRSPERLAHASASAVRILGVNDIWTFHGPQWVSWMDENTLVFIGAPPGSDRSLRPSNLYIWRIGDKPVVYASGRWPRGAEYVCADRGVISYSALPERESDKVGILAYRGRLGSENKVVVAPPMSDKAFWTEVLQANITSVGSTSVSGKRCDYLSVRKFRGKYWIANKSSSTIVDFGERGSKARSLDIYQWSGTSGSFVKRDSLSLSPEDVSPSCSDTPAWDDSIVTWNCYSDTSGIPSFKVFRIYSNGKKAISTIEWRRELVDGHVVPFRDGYLVVNNDSGIRGRGGLFVVRAGRPERLLSGSFRPAAVSPSGCKIALFEFEPEPLSYTHLKVVEVCKSREV